LNVEICGALVKQALRTADYTRGIQLLGLMKKEGIEASTRLIEHLEDLRSRAMNDRLIGETHVLPSIDEVIGLELGVCHHRLQIRMLDRLTVLLCEHQLLISY
jgi:hypothetical protein